MNRFGYGQPIVKIVEDPNPPAVSAQQLTLAYTTHKSGPVVGGDVTNMATSGASQGTPSVFEYTVPANSQFRMARLHLVVSSVAPQPPSLSEFGNLDALAVGSKLDVVDGNGASLVDLTAGRPFQTNKDFIFAAGGDVAILESKDLDVVLVRISLVRLGRNLILEAGQSLRWTIQDNLDGLFEFRCEVQGFSAPS